MTLKLEADFLLDNHRLPGEGVPTPGLFLPQEKDQGSIIHLVSLHPLPHSSSGEAEKVTWREPFMDGAQLGGTSPSTLLPM